jgi:type VI secretion system VasD/TssJ family lipoprotein
MKKVAMLAAVVAALAACGGPSRLYVKGVKPLNENDRKESTPVDVRVYQLKDDSRFNQAAIDKLWTDDKTVLGDDLVAVKVITVFPGSHDDQEKEIVIGELPQNVRFVGLLALFPKEDDKGSRKLILPASDAGKSILTFTGYHISKKD